MTKKSRSRVVKRSYAYRILVGMEEKMVAPIKRRAKQEDRSFSAEIRHLLRLALALPEKPTKNNFREKKSR